MSNSQPPSPTVSSGSDVQFIEQVLDLSASANIDAIPSSLGAVVSPPAVPNLQDVSMSDDESRMAIDFQAPGPSRTDPLMPPAQIPDDVVTLRAMTGSFDSTMRDYPSAFESTSTGSAGSGRIIWTPVGTSAPDAGEFCGPTSQSTPSPSYSAMFRQEELGQVRSPSPPPPQRVVRSPSPPIPVQPPRVIAIPRRYNRNQGNQPAQRGFMPRQILLNRQMHYGTRLAEIAYTVANLWRVATTPEAIAGLSRPDLVARRDHIVGMATEVRNMRQNIGRVFTPAETATMVRLEMMALQFHEFAQTHGTGHPIARFLPMVLFRLQTPMPLGSIVLTLYRIVANTWTGNGVKFGVNSRLTYFPDLSVKTRARIVFIAFCFELTCRTLVHALPIVGALLLNEEINFVQVSLLNIVIALWDLFAFLTCLTIFIKNGSFYISIAVQCAVIGVSELSQMNRLLFQLGRRHRLFPAKFLLQQTQLYRHRHTSLCINFMLRANRSIIGKSIGSFIVTTLMFNAYTLIVIHFSEVSRRMYCLWMFFLITLTLLPLIGTLFFVWANQYVNSSAKHLIPIIGKIRMFQPKWRLMTYFELLHNKRKKIALTAGVFGELNTKHLLEYFLLYGAYLMHFCSRFMVHKRGSIFDA